MRALHTAASGMKAQELNVEVISNNVANLRTTGYKRARAQFVDLVYDTQRRPGATTSAGGNVAPFGLSVGTGVRAVATPRVMGQGNLTATERDYDLAVKGEGFLQVKLNDGRTAYTRDGSLSLDGQGRLVDSAGRPIDPGITIPNNAGKVSIDAQGGVEATLPGKTAPESLGKLNLARFANKVGLEAIGENLFVETPASGPPILGDPGSEGFGEIQQGHLEEANVNAVTEISALIAAQRAYEMNAKVVAAADAMLSSTTQMLR